MTTLRHRMLARASALAVAAGLAAPAPAVASDSPADRALHYVALGDSYVAGPGIADQVNAACGRSDRSLARLIASALGAETLIDASCSAATTQHLWSPQHTNETVQPPQLDSLEPTTTLVTLGTIGGNDVDVAALAATCILEGCGDVSLEPYADAIDALEPIYRDLVAEVRRRSPEATIVAVGYGTPFPAAACASFGVATDSDLHRLQSVVNRLSDTLARVAATEGVAFVEMRDLAGWAEHSACADPAEQWIRGLESHDDGFPLHPSALGMSAMAGHVVQTVEPLLTVTTPPVERPAELPDAPLPAPTTPTPSPSPPAPVEAAPTSAQRLATAARSLRVRATCAGPRSKRRATLRLSGGHGLVRGVTFRLGRGTVGRDTRAPFAVTRSVAALKRPAFRGAVRARVVLRHGSTSRVVTVSAARPRCLR
ncbi:MULTISPECIES: SGNH/GDSL hydrolase family protein [unclassified Aeromicrobium]|uniref:SGNH/GDSL hydrolase family protein n=1 Tax=unclassified Aeromicrobium TaxID=2633570 RepID=UPI00396B21E6